MNQDSPHHPAPPAGQPADQQPPNPARSVPLVLGSIGMLLLLASLDQTIVSTALPTIVADLGGLEHLSWVVTAYILAATIAAPLYGKLGDLYGRRNTVFVSVALFLLGSVVSGMAQDMGQLIAARAVQGLGGGGLFVLALSVVGEVIPPRERGKVQGLFAAVFSVSSIAGPLLGGWFVDNLSWHWIFFVNLPVGALALAGFWAGFHPSGRRLRHRIDWAGAASLSIALAALTLLTALGGQAFDWGAPQAWGLGALALAAALAFVAIEARAAEPILPLELFRMNVFAVTSVVSFLTGAAMFGAIVFLPIYLQLARGATPTQSGLMLIPMTFGILTSSAISGRYMARSGRYKVLPVTGMALVALAAASLTTLAPDTPLWRFSLEIGVFGLGLGLIFSAITTSVQNAVPHERLGAATAAGLMFRQIGASLAIAAFGAIFTARVSAAMGAGGAGPLSGGSLRLSPEQLAALPAPVQARIGEVITQALAPIFWLSAAIAALGFIAALLLAEVPLSERRKGG